MTKRPLSDPTGKEIMDYKINIGLYILDFNFSCRNLRVLLSEIDYLISFSHLQYLIGIKQALLLIREVR